MYKQKNNGMFMIEGVYSLGGVCMCVGGGLTCQVGWVIICFIVDVVG